MPKQKPKITKTLGPIHFEDLDPHRFEDLIRELIYDFRDWQSIEATGRSGNDAGFDIRAYERVNRVTKSESEDGDEAEETHPMDGNLWMVQGKREKEIGPTRVKEILADIDAANPPYGYILAASANFSKDSYDLFRLKLRSKGVMEFYLWGKSELEDMLHLPKNDRILFTFFGISLVSRRRSRATEVRSIITVKNRVVNTLGEDHQLYEAVLVRDLKDDKYPFKDEYPDFQKQPRWKEYKAYAYHPLGVWFHVHDYYGYIDREKREWDYTTEVDLLFSTNESDEEREQRVAAQEHVEGVWDFFPKYKQGRFIIDGAIKFEDMVLFDPKGDVLYNFPHIYVDFEGATGPFAGFGKTFKILGEEIELDDTWTQIKVFPKKCSRPKLGKVHMKSPIKLDPETLKSFKEHYDREMALYSVDNKYNFLNAKDVVPISETGDESERSFIQITNRYQIKIDDYLAQQPGNYFIRRSIQNQLGLNPIEGNEELMMHVHEFKRTYRWKFEKTLKR
jgi:hypothetical protein